jgi:hypothetical protein
MGTGRARMAAAHGPAGVAAAAHVRTAGAATATTAVAAARVLGISQRRRARYRNAEQHRPDDPNNMPRLVHRAISMPEFPALRLDARGAPLFKVTPYKTHRSLDG